MTKEEQIFLLQLILEDIRGNWGWDLEKRVYRARDLAEELGYSQVVEHIDDFEFDDGRHFRCGFKYGGYEGMSELHGLDKKLEGRSKEFFDECDEYLTYPDSALEDWGDRFELFEIE